jgi:cell division protein FtsB
MNDTTTTDKCPHCGAKTASLQEGTTYSCGTNKHPDSTHTRSNGCLNATPRTDAVINDPSDDGCPERGLIIRLEYHSQELERELNRATDRIAQAEDIIKGLHNGWKKARKAHLLTCKNAQAEIDKLHTENVFLQEIIHELYEWTRRDYPTEQEVREIMNRYHDLQNK